MPTLRLSTTTLRLLYFKIVYGAFPLMRFSSRAAAVRLGTFVATMHIQRSVSIDASHTQLYASRATGDMPVNSKCYGHIRSYEKYDRTNRSHRTKF